MLPHSIYSCLICCQSCCATLQHCQLQQAVGVASKGCGAGAGTGTGGGQLLLVSLCVRQTSSRRRGYYRRNCMRIRICLSKCQLQHQHPHSHPCRICVCVAKLPNSGAHTEREREAERGRQADNYTNTSAVHNMKA